MQGRTREIGFWSLVAGLLPLAYLASYAAVGVTPAEGCSGASFEEAGVIHLAAAEEAPVATDGFFPFLATSVNIDGDDALARITVEVRDSGGELVPGDTRLLSTESGNDGLEYLQLGWSASGAAREQGEELSFHAEATNSVESVMLDRSLAVSGVVPELMLPSFEITEWVRVKYDAGPQLTCDTWSDCDSVGVFGSELHDAWQMTLEAPRLAPPVLVVWEFEWEALAGKGRFMEDPRRFDGQTASRESLVFVAGEEEFCVRLRGHDLHTGETEVQDFCGSPSGDETVVWDSIADCAEPPAGYLERWCRSNGDGALDTYSAECEPFLHPPAGAGGAASGDAGGAGGTEPEPPPPGKGGAGSGGRASPSGGAGTQPPVGEPGSGGSTSGKGGSGTSAPPDDENDAGATGGEKHILTEAGCACRVGSTDERDSALGCVGLAVVAVGLGARRRRLERRRS